MNSADRVAIVTGAGRGIGATVARRLAADGYAVGLLDLDEDACKAVADEIVGQGGRAAGFHADVSAEDSVVDAVGRVDRELGPPVCVVNNAGITRDNLLFRMSVDDWDSVMSVHMRGAFLVTRAAQSHMVAANWGRVVNLSSASALGSRGQANYAAAKAGMQGFTKTLAVELGKFSITANAVAPGFIATEMTAATAARMGITFDEFKSQSAAQIPVGRVGEPADAAAAVSFFASEEASFISGQVLYVAGGPLD